MDTPEQRLAALVLAALLLGGCGPSYTYRYSPPPSAHGIHCIDSCQMERNHCKQMARLEENSQRALYQAELRSYQYCQDSKTKKDARHRCHYPSYPYSSGASYSCDRDYDSCYLACGGTIQRILNTD